MKKITLTSLLLFLACTFMSAQDAFREKPYEDGFLQRYGVALKGSTYGMGVDFHTSLLPNLKARVGFNYGNFTYTGQVDFHSDYGVTGNEANYKRVDGYFSETKLTFPNANLLFDFYPVKSGIFCFTAGAYFGQNKFRFKAFAEGPFYWDDIRVDPDKDGLFYPELNLGGVIKPYFGIGLGRTISRHRVSCRFDLGVVYQGNSTILYNDHKIDGIKVFEDNVSGVDVSSLLKLWPMMSFSISYRIK